MSRLGVLTTLHRYQYRPIYPKLLHLVNKNLWYPVYSTEHLHLVNKNLWYPVYSTEHLQSVGRNKLICAWDIKQCRCILSLTFSFDLGKPTNRVDFSIWVGMRIILSVGYNFTAAGLKSTFAPIMWNHDFNLESLYKYSSIPFLSLVLNEL